MSHIAKGALLDFQTLLFPVPSHAKDLQEDFSVEDFLDALQQDQLDVGGEGRHSPESSREPVPTRDEPLIDLTRIVLVQMDQRCFHHHTPSSTQSTRRCPSSSSELGVGTMGTIQRA